MPAPPMNQDIILHIPRLLNGKPELNRNGQIVRDPFPTRARVKLSGDHIITDSGDRQDAVLELTLPPNVPVQTGDLVDWTDEFGRTHSGPIVKLGEVRNYSGTVVYFRKAWTT